MHYMKEILKSNKKWIIVYLLIGLFNANNSFQPVFYLEDRQNDYLFSFGRIYDCIFGNESAAERIVSDQGKNPDRRGSIKPLSCAWFYGNAAFPHETSISK